MKRTLIAVAVALLVAAISGGLALHLYARHTVGRIQSLLSALGTFDNNEGAFKRLGRVRAVCGSACVVVIPPRTDEVKCDPHLCAIRFAFDNRWLSRLRLAPSATVTGYVLVQDDKLHGYFVEYDVDTRDGAAYTAYTEVSNSAENYKKHSLGTLKAGTFNAGPQRDRVGVFSASPPWAQLEDKRCALAFNLGCFTRSSDCHDLATIAPCPFQRASKAQ